MLNLENNSSFYKKSEDEFKKLVESSHIGFIIIQGERIIYINKSITKILEFKSEELMNLKINTILKKINFLFMTNKLNQQDYIFYKYLKQNIKKIAFYDCENNILIHKVKLFKECQNTTYLIEFISKKGKIKKIIGKIHTNEGTYKIMRFFLALYGKYFYKIRDIPLPAERIREQIYCTSKIKKTTIKIPFIYSVNTYPNSRL